MLSKRGQQNDVKKEQENADTLCNIFEQIDLVRREHWSVYEYRKCIFEILVFWIDDKKNKDNKIAAVKQGNLLELQYYFITMKELYIYNKNNPFKSAWPISSLVSPH